jgi:hypothetical protein
MQASKWPFVLFINSQHAMRMSDPEFAVAENKTPVPMPTDDYDRNMKKLDELGAEGRKLISVIPNFSQMFSPAFLTDSCTRAKRPPEFPQVAAHISNMKLLYGHHFFRFPLCLPPSLLSGSDSGPCFGRHDEFLYRLFDRLNPFLRPSCPLTSSHLCS